MQMTSRSRSLWHLSLIATLLLWESWISVAALHAADPKTWINEDSRLQSLIDLYKHFHQHPELSLQEVETSARLAEELKRIGAEVTTSVGGYGVVAVLKNGAGPTVLLRADMDALPVVEETQLPYASKVMTKNDRGQEVGVMHACGHDIHITNLVGVARYLSANKEAWKGTVVFICQPAEERGDGAKMMLDAGLFQRFPRPDYALALHVDSKIAAGRVGYHAGYSSAFVDSIDLTVRGKGGHGAQPERTIDPIVQAAHLIVDLQTIVSREISPFEPAVITVGSIHGGAQYNVIGNSCHLQLTVRSYSDKVRQHLLSAIRRKAQAAAASANAPEPLIELSDGTPAVFNNEQLVDRLVPVFVRVLGKENVVPSELTMGGEDFSRYSLAGVPSMLFRLGGVEAKRLASLSEGGKVPPSLHSPLFYPDAPQVLETGLVAMSSAVLELLPAKQSK